MRLKSCLLAATLMTASSVRAQSGSFGVLGGFGLFAQTRDAADLTRNYVFEKPLAMKFTFDYRLNKFMVFGVEYLRSMGLGPFSSGVGVAQAALRWYPFFEAPEPLQVSPSSPVEYSASGMAFWLSPSMGIAHGATHGNANFGMAFSPSGGIDWHWGGGTFLRGEGSLTMTLIGEGRIVGLTLLVGVFRFF